MPPNPALNRTGRYAVSLLWASARPAGQLIVGRPRSIAITPPRGVTRNGKGP
jgi:hypothetical protein